MKKSLSLFLCILAALLALSACGAKEPPRGEEPAPREESRIPENERDAAPAEPAAEPESEQDPVPSEPEPGPLVPCLNEMEIEYQDLSEFRNQPQMFTLKTRDYYDTQDIDLPAAAVCTWNGAPDGGYQLGLSTFLYPATLGDISGYRVNIYLFDIYTGTALPGEAPTDHEGHGKEQYEWEQTVTINGTDYVLSIVQKYESDTSSDWYSYEVTAPAGYSGLGMIVTSSNVDVTEAIDISNYIAAGDDVHCFVVQAPETQG